MNITAVLLLVALIGFAFAQQQVQGTYGTAVAVSANTDTKINFLAGLGPQLTIRTDSACSIIVNQILTFTALPNNNFQTLSLGTEVGYEIKQSNGNCQIVSAYLQTSPLSVSLVAQVTAAISGGGNVGCLYYNSSSNVFSRVAVQQNTGGFNNGLTVAIPRFGKYVFVTYSQNVPLPTLYADVQIVGGAQGGGGASGSGQTILSFSDGLTLAITSTTQSALTANTYSSLTATGCSCSGPDTNSYKAYGQWFNFDLNNTNSFSADINKTYSAQTLTQLGVTDETKLRLAYYDGSQSKWVFPTNQRVDTSAKVVSCTTTHFSTWGMYAQSQTQSTSSDAAQIVIAVSVLLAAVLLVLM